MEEIKKTEVKTESQVHYERYRPTMRIAQKNYYDRNCADLRDKVRAAYHNNPEARERKKKKMREYNRRRKILLEGLPIS